MGTLTLADLRAELRANLGGRDDVADSRLDRHLNMAQQRISRSSDFTEMRKIGSHTLTLTGDAAQDKYLLLTTNVRKIYSLRLIDGSQSLRLTGTPRHKWDTLLPATEHLSLGRPERYTRWGNTLEFYRVPNVAWQLIMRWSNWPTAFTSVSQLSDLDEKDDLILALATFTMFSSLGQKDDGFVYLSTAKAMLNEAVIEDRSEPDIDYSGGGVVAGDFPLGDYWADPFVNRSP